MNEQTANQENQIQSLANSISCYYHPSRQDTKKIQCDTCKNYFCEEDNFLAQRTHSNRKICPVCLLKEHTTRFFQGIIIFIVIGIILLIIDTGTSYALYEVLTEPTYASEMLPIIATSLFFWILTIIILGAPYGDYKNTLKLEMGFLPFFQSIEVFHDEKLREYKEELEEKYNKQKIS